MLFLAGIGTKAGDGLLSTLAAGGAPILIFGAVLTGTVTTLALLMATVQLKLPSAASMGMMSGIQTQPACLAYANEHSRSDLPNVWYAAVYPVSMIAKIIIAQILVRLVL